MDEDILCYLSGNINFTEFLQKIDQEVEDANKEASSSSNTNQPKQQDNYENEDESSQHSQPSLSTSLAEQPTKASEVAQIDYRQDSIATPNAFCREISSLAKDTSRNAETYFSLFEKFRDLVPSHTLATKNQEMELQDSIDARKVFRKARRLPYHLKVEMGKANVLLAKGEFKKAEEICLDIVKQEPKNVQPFHTLALIHEEQGQEEKAVQYSLISAYMECRDAEEWHELGRRCYRLGNIKQASMCLTKACTYDKNNIGYRWERACLFVEAREYQNAVREFSKILKIIPETKKELYLEVCKDIAKLYHKVNNANSALKTLRTLLEKYPDFVDLEVVNMMGELLIGKGEYSEALQVISTFCGLSCGESSKESAEKCGLEEHATESEDHEQRVELDNQTVSELANYVNMSVNDNFSFASSFVEGLMTEKPKDLPTSAEHVDDQHQQSDGIQPMQYADLDTIDRTDVTEQVEQETSEDEIWTIPPEMPVDLVAKVTICLIHLHRKCNLSIFMEQILSHGIETVGDLILDVADAFSAVGSEDVAIGYLEQLVKTETYNKAAVWLKLGQCHQSCGHISDTVTAFETVLQLAPNQLRTRSELGKIYTSLGRQQDALRVLTDYVLKHDSVGNKMQADGAIQVEVFI